MTVIHPFPRIGHDRPLVFARRGASGYVPEHTRVAHETALQQGADGLEINVVWTADGHPIIRDRRALAHSTTAPELFQSLAPWHSDGLTLDQVSRLHALEPMRAQRPFSAGHDGRYPIVTLADYKRWVHQRSAELERPIPTLLEIKDPLHFGRIAERLAPHLENWTEPLALMAFEVGPLRELRPHLDLPLIQILDAARKQPPDFIAGGRTGTYGDLATRDGLEAIATYASGVAPWRDLIMPRDEDDDWTAPTTFVADAHAASLAVFPWYFRRENPFLPRRLRSDSQRPASIGDGQAEIKAFLALGVDGVIGDNPDLARAAVEA